MYDEVKKFDGDDQENHHRCLFFSMVYPNSRLMTPFDIVFDKMELNSVQILEIIMKMFQELPDYKLSQCIKRRIPKMLTLGMPSFEAYLEQCTF